jgi:ABC-2 family transporter protein
MTWLTWRQFRSQTWVAIAGLIAIGVALLAAAKAVSDLYTASGAAACRTSCDSVIENFLQQAQSGWTGVIYNAGIFVLYILPGLIGAFWGAPLVARELEAGTHRLAWNQSVTRTRWLLTKLGVVGAATVATMGLLSLAITWFSSRLDEGTANMIKPELFGARDVVPIAYGLFAFAVGVTAGILIRRTVPAMAVTLAVYLGVAVAMPLWIRQHLLPASHTAPLLDIDNIHGLMIGGLDRRLTVLGDTNVSGWILSNQTVTPTGAVFTGPADPQYCDEAGGPRTCLNWIGTLNLRQDIVYQPASHYWPLQWIESGVLVAVAAVLIALCLRWTRRLT